MRAAYGSLSTGAFRTGRDGELPEGDKVGSERRVRGGDGRARTWVFS